MKTALAMAVFTAVIFGTGWFSRMAWDGWKRAERAIDEAIAMVCKPCSWTDPTAPCTCPDKGCTAMGCPKREVRRG